MNTNDNLPEGAPDIKISWNSDVINTLGLNISENELNTLSFSDLVDLANNSTELDDSNKSSTLVVNLFAGPGAGKSTTAAGIFYELKSRGINCELATEYAKDLTWEKRHDTFRYQIYLFGKQYHRIFRLLGEVDVIITDSPILLTSIYDTKKTKVFV